MLGVDSTELLVVAVVALLVIGPKDLPRAMRFVGKWVGKARGISRQFRAGIDTMIRESELAEMEQQWAAENERIMREHPPTPSLPAPQPEHFAPDNTVDPADADPVMVEQPALFPATEASEPAKPKRVRKPKAAPPEESRP
ncbi:twin-arginine translocase subunit TatB [Sphingomonas gei]|uniref:Twin-arginine translocase subunit TatB n=1 Tax=Sphingomonas gei TaxID=1395960 RepID=A0A4S1XHR5_9SPHN|nr:Sec-independent protein translocase protein TatB [Sphingomonas gei]TGX55608.1 twin-arginine translocase subunit TatB [Sphingomonas gei]